MRSQIQFLKAFVASPLLILGLAILCCGCKGGFGRNVNPYAAYGSPRIPPPGTGAIGTNNGSNSAPGSAPVGTGVSASQPNATFNNSSTNTPNPPYYSGNANFRDSSNGATTGSVPATPVSGGNQWRSIDRSDSLPQSRIPSQGTSIQGGSPPTQNFTTQNDNTTNPSPQDSFASQVAPASYLEPSNTQAPADAQQTTVDHLLNGMRVNDATRQNAPGQFTPPADARPLTAATGSQPNMQSSWSSSNNSALPQQNPPPTAVASQMTQEEFAAFVQGVPPQATTPNGSTQAVAVATTLPNAASFDPNASSQTAAQGTPTNSTGTSGGWQTRDE